MFKKKKRKKRLPASGAMQTRGAAAQGGNELEDYKARIAYYRKRNIIRALIAVGAVALIAFLVVFVIQKRSYHSYKVIATSDQEDTVSTKYTELDGKLFKYSGQGASLVSKEQETLWNVAYDEMQNPTTDKCGETIVVYDQGNTTMAIFNEEGQLGSVQTSLNIVKARVARQGVVAAILDGGDDTWINFYAADGSLIAENQTRVDDPGYPLDISVSEDGMMIMVTYQFVDGGKTTSYVAFYNFGTVGQNQIDNIVSGYKYEGVVIPQVAYLKDDIAVAFRDDGFTLFKGKQVPKEGNTVKVEKEIVSAFYDEDMVGLVFKNDNKESKDKQYVMNVYGTNGNLKFKKEFSIPYTNIKVSGGQVVMNNSSQVCVISGSGVEKFNGTIDEGSISDFFKLGMNRYMLVLDNGLSTIKFK
ncbi:MAG: DUF5711 family protein [Blautia sp.]